MKKELSWHTYNLSTNCNGKIQRMVQKRKWHQEYSWMFVKTFFKIAKAHNEINQIFTFAKSGKKQLLNMNKVNHIIQVQKQIISTALNSSIA